MSQKKGAKRRKRGKGSKRPSVKLYFHSGTHNAIINFQNSNDQSEKAQIYIDEILPAFDKLAENLIFIHGFAKPHGSFEDLKSDCVTFLYETLEKFDHTRGTKAFSYFNVVAKNWLIIQSKKKTKQNRRHVSIDDSTSLSSSDLSAIELHQTAPSQDEEIFKKESMDNLFDLMSEIRETITGENEIACMDAIITLFRKIEDLDFLNKRAVFVYMRDLSSLNPKQLSVAMSVIRKHYKSLVKSGDYDIF